MEITNTNEEKANLKLSSLYLNQLILEYIKITEG